MNKQIQTCCICLNNLSNVKNDTHHFSCCAGAMHQACYSQFCGTLFSSHCPYCRRAHHRACQKIENKSKYESRIPIDMDIDEATNLYDLNVLDFM